MQKWFVSVTVTAAYQRLSDLLDGVSGFPGMRVLQSGRLRVSADSTKSIRISRVPPSVTTGDDSLSNLFNPGESCEFDVLDSTHIYIKTDSGTATLEVQTDEL
jgi:hypothetical protein